MPFVLVSFLTGRIAPAPAVMVDAPPLEDQRRIESLAKPANKVKEDRLLVRGEACGFSG